MNVQVHYPDLTLSRRAVPSTWRETGASIVIGGETPRDPVKIWPAADWRELVELWIRGISASAIAKLFAARGYTLQDLDRLRALIVANDRILLPTDRALFVLAGVALRDDRSPGGFTINGRPARALDVVDAANRILGSLALPLIRYPNARGV